jgi:hypothetical protein
VAVEEDHTTVATTTMVMAEVLATLHSRTQTTLGQYTMEVEVTIRVGHSISHSKDLPKGGALLPVPTTVALKDRLVVTITIKILLNNQILALRTATSAKSTATRHTIRKAVTLHLILTPLFPRCPNAIMVRRNSGRILLVSTILCLQK